jgi:dissimilatory sulfite reductase (desulfoviridin) alpha/beta subunit
VYAGGKHGRHPHAAYPVASFVSDEQVPAVVGATLDWYREHGQRGERIGETLDRAGIDSYRRALKPAVGEALLAQADLRKQKWSRLFCRGIADAFPPYGDV